MCSLYDAFMIHVSGFASFYWTFSRLHFLCCMIQNTINVVSLLIHLLYRCTSTFQFLCIVTTTLSSACQWTPLSILLSRRWLKVAYLTARLWGLTMWISCQLSAFSWQPCCLPILSFNVQCSRPFRSNYFLLPTSYFLLLTSYHPLTLTAFSASSFRPYSCLLLAVCCQLPSGEYRSRTDDLLLAKQAL